MTVIRTARTSEAGAIARIEVETWRAAYPGILSERVLLGMSEERQALSWARALRSEGRFEGERVVVASEHGLPVGFASFGDRRQPGDGITAEIYTLYVAQDWQNRGIGRRLLRACFARLSADGHEGALLWVLRDNAARFFYERMGGKAMMSRAIPVGREPVETVAYGWPDLRAALAFPA